jgi:anti-sigma regulatory factor (Ser/Thr protein kinase)
VVIAKRSFAKSLVSLDGVFDFLQEFTDEEAIAEKHVFAINLVVEELFTNMVKYSGGADHEIAISIDKNDHQVMLQLTDFDSDPFDPESVSDVDVSAPIEERQPGGLGLHIVRTMVDDLHYEMDERKLTISVRKSLES